MVWFNKNKKEDAPELADLPALPQLPKLPDFSSDSMQFKPNALPRFPSSALGDKFSQNTIKDAISGEKEDDEELANESDEIQTMPKLPAGPLTKEVSSSIMKESPVEKPAQQRGGYSMGLSESKTGPMYVRLDKFEENIEVFDKIKRQLVGVEKILDDIKRTKEQEDKELGDWQAKLQTMKEQVEKIDKDIFSKVE